MESDDEGFPKQGGEALEIGDDSEGEVYDEEEDEDLPPSAPQG